MEAIVGIIVGTFALYVGYKRLAFVSALFKRREQLERMEKALRESREHASGPSPWRIAGEQDHELVAMLDAAEADARALEALGFRRLGDAVGAYPGRGPTLALRILVKEAQNAGIIINRTSQTHVLISISSYGAEKTFTTSRRADGRSLAMPPWLHQNRLGVKASVADIVREHAATTPTEGMLAFGTIEEVLANIANQHARIRQWRDAQPPDELLEADLRGLLGKHYERAGAYWTRKLRAKLPDATLRRR